MAEPDTDPAVDYDIGELLARCPYCEAIFKVGQHKLEPRQGEVRCGACREVFNAFRHEVVRNALGQYELVDAEQGAEQEAKTDIADEQTEGATGADPDQPSGAEVAADRRPSLQELVERNLGAVESVHEEDSDTRLTTDGVDAKDLLQADTDLAAQLESTRPIASISLDQPSVQPEPLADEPALAVEHDRSNWFSAEPDPQLDNNPFAERDQPAKSAESPTPEPSQFNMQGVDAYIMDRPNPLITLMWAMVSLGFIVLLGLQVKLFFVERFAQDREYRPYLTVFCQIAACELPPRRNAYRFTITNTRIDLHPSEPGALRVSVKLLNQAEFSQPYPDLQLTLTDRVGRVVGRRSFQPEFYLESGRTNQLASGELGAVVFDLARPHEKAVGFVVNIVRNPAVG